MEKLKKALLTVIETGETSVDALEDGKISLDEGVAITWKAVGFIKIIRNIKVIIAEYKALTVDQKVELSAWFTLEFDIANDAAEKIVEDIFNILLNLNDVFDRVAA